MIKPAYLMESERESERLLIKGDRKTTREQLLLTGFAELPHEARIIDAGSGAGFVSRVMAETAFEIDKSFHLSLLDSSRERLNVAQSGLEDQKKVSADFIQCDLTNIPLRDNVADYVFCRFVFEYLTDPEAVFAELVRITKSGGKIVVGDLDYNCLSHYPLNPELEQQLKWMMDHLLAKQLIDPYAGRKLYSYFYGHQLLKIKPHLLPHHLFYGKLSEEDRFNWEAKLIQIEDLAKKKVISAPFSLTEFRFRFMNFLKSPERFTYTPLILVEGVKP